MPRYLDFQFENNEYETSKKYYDDNAIILAIKNILFSRPGNFPFNPSIGLNIQQYQFEFLDDGTIEDIRKELTRQLSLYMPDIGNVDIGIVKVNNEENGMPYLGISIGTNPFNDALESNFLIGQEDGKIVKVFNETN